MNFVTANRNLGAVDNFLLNRRNKIESRLVKYDISGYCGNSGTTMRLLAGLLAAQEFTSELVGDESLSRRPMDRVVAPLIEMGAAAQWPPLRVGGRVPLHGIEYRQPVASAQVKSAILLAGLFAAGTTAVIEPVPTRNHTELMLRAMGADVKVEGTRVAVGRASLLAAIR